MIWRSIVVATHSIALSLPNRLFDEPMAMCSKKNSQETVVHFDSPTEDPKDSRPKTPSLDAMKLTPTPRKRMQYHFIHES